MVVNVLRKFIPGDEVTFKIANRWGHGIIYCVSLSLLEDIYQYSIKETGGGVVNADEKDIKLIKRRQGEDMNQSAENNLLEHKFQVGDLVCLTFNSVKKEGIITGQEGLDNKGACLYTFKSNRGEIFNQVCEYFLVHTSVLTQPKFKLGEKIEFWYNDEWCPGTIIGVEQKRYRIIYKISGSGKARNEYGFPYSRGEMGIRVLTDDLTMRILSDGCSDYIETDNPTYTTASSGIIIDWDKTFELQNDFAKQSPKSEPEHSEGLIPNPCPTGRYYLPGTGHHFDTYEGKTIYFDKNDNVIPNGNEHTVGATADTFCYLPDNLKFNNMNREDIKLINNGVYRNRRLSQEYERLQREQKRERKLLRRENRRKVWRKAKQWILITTIATVIFGASFDYKHGCTPRGWVKGALSYVGYQLQALGSEQNLTK